MVPHLGRQGLLLLASVRLPVSLIGVLRACGEEAFLSERLSDLAGADAFTAKRYTPDPASCVTGDIDQGISVLFVTPGAARRWQPVRLIRSLSITVTRIWRMLMRLVSKSWELLVGIGLRR